MSKNNPVVQTLMTMAVLYDKQMNEDAAELFLSDLSELSEDSILGALKKCRLELQKFPTVSDIVTRAQKNDGRPGSEEAWSLIPRDESGSVVWTEEMRKAHGVACKLMNEDMIAARMAFKESYESAVKESRSKNLPIKWVHSFGYDKLGREKAIRESVERNRLTVEQALVLLPEIVINEPISLPQQENAAVVKKLIGGVFK